MERWRGWLPALISLLVISAAPYFWIVQQCSRELLRLRVLEKSAAFAVESAFFTEVLVEKACLRSRSAPCCLSAEAKRALSSLSGVWPIPVMALDVTCLDDTSMAPWTAEERAQRVAVIRQQLARTRSKIAELEENVFVTLFLESGFFPWNGKALLLLVVALSVAVIPGLVCLVKLFVRCCLVLGRDNQIRHLRWFCRGESRQILDHALRDIRRDAREMLRRGYSRAFVRSVSLWATVHCIVPILVDCAVRGTKKALFISSIEEAIKSRPRN